MGQTFFPPFEGSGLDRTLNLMVNANPITFGIRAFFLTQPRFAEVLGPTADAIIRAQRLPANLFGLPQTADGPLQVGDRVKASNRSWPGSELFGGYILALFGDWALFQWDFIPIGPLTYDPLSWVEPQMLQEG